MKKKASNLSIIIPCFNESKIIEQTIFKVSKWCSKNKLNFEILIINNNSTDNTESIIEKFVSKSVLLLNEYQKGKGYAVKKGLVNAKYNNVLILDADLSTDISHFDVQWLNSQNKLIVGSRPIGNEIGTPFVRKIYGYTLNFIIRKLFLINLKDTQCGFKFLSSPDLNGLAEKIEIGGFMYDLNLILLCIDNDYEIIEIPINYKYNKNSTVSLLKDPIKMFLDLINLKKNF